MTDAEDAEDMEEFEINMQNFKKYFGDVIPRTTRRETVVEQSRRDEMKQKVSEFLKEEQFDELPATFQSNPQEAAAFVAKIVENLYDLKLGTSQVKLACKEKYEFIQTFAFHNFSFRYRFLMQDGTIAHTTYVQCPESGEMVQFRGRVFVFDYNNRASPLTMRDKLIHLAAWLLIEVTDHFKAYKEMLRKIEQAKK